MSTKHTAGPWILQGDITLVGDPYSKTGQHALYCAEIRHPDFGGCVCTIQSADHVDTGITRETAEANARLIAAAPELLEALRWYVTHDEVSDCAGEEFWLEGRERARAAISKATGEQA